MMTQSCNIVLEINLLNTPFCILFLCWRIDPEDESEQVRASGSLKRHANRRPDSTSGNIQSKRQHILTIHIECVEYIFIVFMYLQSFLTSVPSHSL